MREEMETFEYHLTPRTSSHRKVPKDSSGVRVSENVPDGGGDECGKASSPRDSKNTPLRDITNRLPEDEGKSKSSRNSSSCPWKNEVARERWKILAKALLNPEKLPGKGTTTTTTTDISVRRFSTFDLVTSTILEKLANPDACWLRYSTTYLNTVYHIDILHLEPKLTPKDLIGFNNTGNICIWPSEEVLTYYILTKLDEFQGKEVLEIGGGMTCLAGVMLAKYGKVKKTNLTDGNLISVDNVKKIVGRNKLDKTKVAAFQLDWTNHGRLRETYDVVLCSDCLFFDETRPDLVETIWNSLRDSGVALVMAPKRGNTLDAFVKMAAERGFSCVLLTYYEDTVWRQHLKFKEFSQEYEEDLHYPILVLLTKSGQGVPLSRFLSPY